MYEYTRDDMPDSSRYSWERVEGDEPPTGHDANFAHRGEGYEILPLVNSVMKATGRASKEIARSIEKDVHKSEIRGRDELVKHLVLNDNGRHAIRMLGLMRKKK